MKVFKGLIKMNMEAYIDDILVKSNSFEQHLTNLVEVFRVFEVHRMKFNPIKCVFSMKAGKFLGFIVSKNCIKPNSKKLKAIMDMSLMKNV